MKRTFRKLGFGAKKLGRTEKGWTDYKGWTEYMGWTEYKGWTE
jgi:hypothetical protein